MYSPAPGADPIAQVLDYFFCFPDRIDGVKTPCAFWRYKVNEILSELDIVPYDAVEVETRANGYTFPSALRT